jgi:hypothetical protein
MLVAEDSVPKIDARGLAPRSSRPPRPIGRAIDIARRLPDIEIHLVECLAIDSLTVVKFWVGRSPRSAERGS